MIAKLVSCAVLVAALAVGTTQTLPGVYALQTGKAKALAHLVATATAGDPLMQRLDVSLGDDNGTIRRYRIDMTKFVHLIIVSDDFRTFMHVHPRLLANGHFTIVQRFPRPALYHVYSDAEPAGLGQQVFRYDLDLSAAGGVAETRDLIPTGATVAAGPYRVTLDSTTIHAGAESHLRVRVTKDGKLARDLRPYLGALAHAVFVDGTDLTYAHVHPAAPGAMSDMDMDAGDAMTTTPALADGDASSPTMDLHVAVRERGTYELWLEFRGGGALHVAAFVIDAR